MSLSIISLLCGLGGMFGWGIYDFLGGVYSKQIGPFKSIFWSQLAGVGFMLLLLSATLLATPSKILPVRP